MMKSLRILAAMAVVALAAGCMSSGVKVVKGGTASRPDGCSLDDFDDPAKVDHPYEILCEIDTRAFLSFLFISSVADAVLRVKHQACGCGADAVIMVASGNVNGTPYAKGTAIRYTGPRSAQAAAAARGPAPVVRPAGPVVNHTMGVIAVSELGAEGVSASDSAVIAELLRNRLVNQGGISVVEKKNMDKIMGEQAFQQTGCTNQECAVKLGKLLNVQGIVVGSFGKLLGRYIVSVRLVDVESGKVIYADEAKGDTVDRIDDELTVMAARFVAHIP